MAKLRTFVGDTLIYGFGNVFSRFFAMMLVPLFIGFLGKTDYSNFVMLQSVFTLLTLFLNLNSGAFYYYYEYESQRYKRIVFSSWIYYQFALAVILSLALVFFSSFFSGFFVVDASNSLTIKYSLMLLGVQLFPFVLNITNINYFRIDLKPKKVVEIVFFESLFTLVLVYITLRYLNGGLIGVVIAQIIARSLTAMLNLRTSLSYIKLMSFSKKLLYKLLEFTWPFIVVSVLSIIIVNVDKFIGASTLANKDDVAFLALAMQLVIPISVLADMISMALSPYIMSIRKEKDSDTSYQKVYELSVFSGLATLIVVVMASPVLTIFLADKTYMQAVFLVPLLALAKVISMSSTHFSVRFTLAKKNIYILYSSLIGSVLTITINYFFLNKYGFLVSGISQIVSYTIMSIFLYNLGKKIAGLNIKLKNTSILLFIVLFYLISLLFTLPMVLNGKYVLFVLTGVFAIAIISLTYLHQQNLSLKAVLNMLLGRFRR